MALNKVTYENDTHTITIQRTSGSWYLQVMKGLNIHVESLDFESFNRAISYAKEKYRMHQ